MESPLCLRYRQCEIRACALVDAAAGEGWCDAQGRREAHLLDPKHHAFRHDTDALRISIALAKRFIDTELVGICMPAG
ncbi:TPA: hypothetical protein QDA83_000746 [Burkholderia multivorans]|uniref:hypothetical protein n=1 Tax=Burkholderia multivorans TaxID=87883 RepID=UPI000CFE94A6|nr:hypothetical protein [Burkholderia multivorans]MBU9295651.1 hypothetical protein [Burkholderia multivorans]MBU9304231.1 hypothetical protein [Burkholderia multivorans]MBU9405083.1 hypothetical protein [Burkholderia multivorans]MBU9500123.1 hypothetical protein [Burkholderia multivorans]MBU9505090.1 hypothetical protein [Burkholderia multivorans]